MKSTQSKIILPTLTRNELRDINHYPICKGSEHLEELCGCEVAAMLNKIEDYVKKEKLKSFEEGIKKGRFLGLAGARKLNLTE